MTVYPGMKPPKIVLQSRSQPVLVHKATGQTFILVRDDVQANGKLYIAPEGMITSMRSIKPEEVKEFFEWRVSPSDIPKPDVIVETSDQTSQPNTQQSVEASMESQKKVGRPKGKKDSKPRARKTKTS